MKNEYLNDIRNLLQRYIISEIELNDIVNDYDQMYQDGLARGLSDEEVIDFLGKPEKVVDGLSEGYELKVERTVRSGNKLVALMPFITAITYFILGYFFDLWHPGWLVFLLIPIVAIVTNAKTTFLATLTALSPFVATITFILLGTYLHAWVPGWIIFLIIPMIGALNSEQKGKSIGFALSILIACGIYLYVGYVYHDWTLGALGFIIPIAFGLLTNEINISVSWGGLPEKLTLILTLVVYFVCGYFFHTWAYLWMVFLLIPMVAIISHTKSKDMLVALSPFVAVILFFSLGYFFDLWYVAWMVFFLIPIMGIVGHAGKKNVLIALSPFIAVTIFFTLGFFFHLWAVAWIAFLIIPVTAIVKNA